MSANGTRRRLLICSVCQFETLSMGGFVWHQTSAHGRSSGNGIPGTSRKRTRREHDEPDRRRPSSRRRLSQAPGACASTAGSGATDGQPGRASSSSSLVHPATIPGLGALTADDPGSYDAAIRAQLYPILEMTGVPLDGDEGAAVSLHTGVGEEGAEYPYNTLSTRVRGLYEVLNDAARSVPIVEHGKQPRAGRFNTPRLRALQQFVLGVGGAGLSVREQRQLYIFLEAWDRRDDRDPMHPDDDYSLSAVFPSISSFTRALRDDLHDAVLSAGWMKLSIQEGGTVYEVYYRSVLDVALQQLRSQPGNVRLWSGDAGPGPPSDRRERPLDGDAFRLCEQEVCSSFGGASFVLGLHLYSDSSQLSWSGGTLLLFRVDYCCLNAFIELLIY